MPIFKINQFRVETLGRVFGTKAFVAALDDGIPLAYERARDALQVAQGLWASFLTASSRNQNYDVGSSCKRDAAPSNDFAPAQISSGSQWLRGTSRTAARERSAVHLPA